MLFSSSIAYLRLFRIFARMADYLWVFVGHILLVIRDHYATMFNITVTKIYIRLELLK